MDKLKKIDKEFLLTDSTVNSYGFRLLTSGYLLDEFKKNPVGYYMHGKSKENHPREEGVLVTWGDFRQEGDKVFAKPTINLTHPRGQRTVDEIESGFLNAASLGHFVVLEMDKNPSNPLPHQTGPDVTKWYNRECSLVDIPGNFNALQLFDQNGEEINLADFSNKKQTMEKIILTTAQLALIPDLKADANQADVDTAIQNLVAKAAKVDSLTTELAAATTAKQTAEQALATYKTEQSKAAVKDLCAQAVTDKKVTQEAANKLETQYAENPEGLKDLLASFKSYEPVVKNLKAGGEKTATLADMSYDELDKAGKLEDLKADNAELFFEKYEEHFKKRHTSDTRK